MNGDPTSAATPDRGAAAERDAAAERAISADQLSLGRRLRQPRTILSLILPIVILVHGNSSGVNSFEEYFVAARAGTDLTTSAAFTFTTDAAVREQLASALLGGEVDEARVDGDTGALGIPEG